MSWRRASSAKAGPFHNDEKFRPLPGTLSMSGRVFVVRQGPARQIGSLEAKLIAELQPNGNTRLRDPVSCKPSGRQRTRPPKNMPTRCPGPVSLELGEAIQRRVARLLTQEVARLAARERLQAAEQGFQRVYSHLLNVHALPWSEPQAYACVRLAKRISRPGIKLRVLRRFQQLLHDQNWPTSKRRMIRVPWELPQALGEQAEEACLEPLRAVNLAWYRWLRQHTAVVRGERVTFAKKSGRPQKRARTMRMQSWGQLGMRCCQV